MQWDIGLSAVPFSFRPTFNKFMGVMCKGSLLQPWPKNLHKVYCYEFILKLFVN